MTQNTTAVPARNQMETWGNRYTNNSGPINTPNSGIGNNGFGNSGFGNRGFGNSFSNNPAQMNSMVSLLMQLLQQLQAPQGGTQQPQTQPLPPTPPTQPQKPVPVPLPTLPAIAMERNGRVMVNNKSYSNDFLSQKFQEFKSSPAYQAMGPAVSADLRPTSWGYQGSSTVLQAYYNYVAQTYPNGSAGVNPAPNLPGAPGKPGTPGTPPNVMGNQTPVNAVQGNGALTLNNKATYSNDFVSQKFQEFKSSNQYPAAQTKDLVQTPWGYQGSSSALTAFHNYLLQTYPTGSPAIQPNPPAPPVQPKPNNNGVGNQTAVNVVERNGTVTLNKQVSYSNNFLNQKYQEFQNSDQRPLIATSDLANTAWGYNGSGSTLTAFYNYMLQQYPKGGK